LGFCNFKENFAGLRGACVDARCKHCSRAADENHLKVALKPPEVFQNFLTGKTTGESVSGKLGCGPRDAVTQ